MHHRRWLALSLACVPLLGAPTLGVVDFNQVIHSSQKAQTEQKALDSLRKELEGQVTTIEKEIQTLSDQLKDPDHLDSLSQEAEGEMRLKLQGLAEERMRMIQAVTGQYQQAAQKYLQSIAQAVGQVSAEVAKKRGLQMIVNKESVFYALPEADCTQDVIQLLDSSSSS